MTFIVFLNIKNLKKVLFCLISMLFILCCTVYDIQPPSKFMHVKHFFTQLCNYLALCFSYLKLLDLDAYLQIQIYSKAQFVKAIRNSTCTNLMHIFDKA